MTPDLTLTRCQWVSAQRPEDVVYHDLEWGVPVHDDRVFFEFLILESAQAGLSWYTVLKKRAAYRRAFADFDPHVVAAYTEQTNWCWMLVSSGIAASWRRRWGMPGFFAKSSENLAVLMRTSGASWTACR